MFFTLGYHLDELFEHEYVKGRDMEAGQCFRQPFVVAGQASKTGDSSETALDHPATRQQDKAFLSQGQLDRLQLWAVFGRVVSGLFTGVALSNKGHLLDRRAGFFLNLLANSATWARSCSSAGVTKKASTWPSVSTARWTLLPRLRMAPS